MTIDELVSKITIAYSEGNWEQADKLDLLIANMEKAERMKDVKVSKYRDPAETRMYHFTDIGRIAK